MVKLSGVSEASAISWIRVSESWICLFPIKIWCKLTTTAFLLNTTELITTLSAFSETRDLKETWKKLGHQSLNDENPTTSLLTGVRPDEEVLSLGFQGCDVDGGRIRECTAPAEDSLKFFVYVGKSSIKFIMLLFYWAGYLLFQT